MHALAWSAIGDTRAPSTQNQRARPRSTSTDLTGRCHRLQKIPAKIMLLTHTLNGTDSQCEEDAQRLCHIRTLQGKVRNAVMGLRHVYFLFQFSSVAQSCPTLCDPVNRSTPGLPVHHQLPEFTQTHAHRVGDAIQPSHPLSSPSPPAPNPSQHFLFIYAQK